MFVYYYASKSSSALIPFYSHPLPFQGKKDSDASFLRKLGHALKHFFCTNVNLLYLLLCTWPFSFNKCISGMVIGDLGPA